MKNRLSLILLALATTAVPIAAVAKPDVGKAERSKVSLAAAAKVDADDRDEEAEHLNRWPWPFRRWPLQLSYDIQPLAVANAAAATYPSSYRVTYCGAPWAVAKARQVTKKWGSRSATVVDTATGAKVQVGTEAELMALVQRYDASTSTLEVYLNGTAVATLSPAVATSSSIWPMRRCGEVTLPYRPTSTPPVKPGPFYDGAGYYLTTSTYTPPQSPYGYPWLLGEVDAYVAIRDGEAARWRDAQSGPWKLSSSTPARASDVLQICQSISAKTYAALSMNGRDYASSWLPHLAAPAGWMTFACLTPPTAARGPQPSTSELGAVLMWYGKVNKHTQPTASTSASSAAWVWANDPDGVSGGNLDAVRYCQKWFPQTRSAYLAGQTMADDWRNRGLTGSFTGAGNMYVCSAQPTPTTTTGS